MVSQDSGQDGVSICCRPFFWGYHHFDLLCGSGASWVKDPWRSSTRNVYSDRSFSYLSEVRKRDAEEWIRSSTPREFTRDFVGEENFAKAMVRLREGLLGDCGNN